METISMEKPSISKLLIWETRYFDRNSRFMEDILDVSFIIIIIIIIVVVVVINII